jgi:GTP pyrophosphokinase
VTPSTVLKSGDEVAIKTSPHQTPRLDWLKVVKTARAKSKIKQWLKVKGFEQSVALGREMLERDLKKKHLKIPPEPELSDVAAMIGQTSVEQLFAEIGTGKVSVQSVVQKIAPAEEETKSAPSLVRRFIDQARGVSKGVKVSGVDNMMFRFAECCQPVPGEKIVGYVTRGRGLTIHRADCKNVSELFNEPERKIDVEWDVLKGESFLVKIAAAVDDRKNLLKEITEVIADIDINVRAAEINGDAMPAVGRFVLEIQHYGQLNKAIDKIKKVRGVLNAYRESGIEIIRDDEDKRKK